MWQSNDRVSIMKKKDTGNSPCIINGKLIRGGNCNFPILKKENPVVSRKDR